MRQFLKKGLMRKLALYYSTLSFAIIILVAGTAYILAKSSLQQSMIDRLKLAVSFKEHDIQQWFTLQRQDILLLSQLPDIQLRVETLLQDELSDQSVILSLKKILFNITKTKANIKIISIVSNQGIVLVSTHHLLEKTYQPLGHLTTYITDFDSPIRPILYNSVITHHKSITFLTPIYNQQQQRMAYLSIELDLEEINKTIQNSWEGEQELQSYLIGQIGTRKAFINSHELSDEHQEMEPSSQAIELALQGKDGSGLYINHQGVAVLGLYQWLEDKNMALIAEISQEKAFSLAQKLAQNILIIGCLFLVIVLTVIYVVSHQIVKPVLQVSQAAIKISQGDFNCRVPVISQDEMGCLAVTFNSMVEQLNQSFHQLELTNEELQLKIIEIQRANEIAEAANRVKSEFIAQMSHELKTPLNSILGFSQVLWEDPLIPELQKSFVQNISTSGQKLLELINDVIDISQNTSQPETNCLSSIDLIEFSERLISDFKSSLRRKSLQLSYQIDPHIPRIVQIDAELLRRIGSYLLDNAIKFTEKGEILLKITRAEKYLEQRSIESSLVYRDSNCAQKDWLKLEIKDTGCGIAPAELTDIFEPFSRPIKQSGFQPGMGLGLPLCQKLVRRMEGEIMVESEVGVGTTVKVIIPFQQSAANGELTYCGSDKLEDSVPGLMSLEDLRQEMAQLPRLWVKSLYQLSCQADDEQVIRLLDDLPQGYQTVKETIADLAKNYHLDTILEVIEPLVMEK